VPNPLLVAVLARAFLAGRPTAAQVVIRIDEMFGRRWRWVHPLAGRYIKAYEGQTRPRHREVVRFLLRDRGFKRAWSKYAHELSIGQWLTEPQQMQPVATAREWPIPAIESAPALAVWLGLSPGELEWFADLKGLARHRKTDQQLRHYHYRVFAKRSGNVRLIESPKPRLKELQRQILSLLLDEVPLHPAVHGFQSLVPEFRPSCAQPATPSRWQTCLVEYAQTLLREMSGRNLRFMSILFNCVRFAIYIGSRIYPRARQLRLLSQTFAATAWTAVWPV
jgi:hypothetical protein